jgi:hypothetical protein
MVREHGDLSSDVPDVTSDWDAKGLTWQVAPLRPAHGTARLSVAAPQAMESMKPALAGGLSSRCIVGESGPMHLVKARPAPPPLYMQMGAVFCLL